MVITWSKSRNCVVLKLMLLPNVNLIRSTILICNSTNFKVHSHVLNTMVPSKSQWKYILNITYYLTYRNCNVTAMADLFWPAQCPRSPLAAWKCINMIGRPNALSPNLKYENAVTLLRRYEHGINKWHHKNILEGMRITDFWLWSWSGL